MELFRTSGVCARGIELEVENGIVKDIKFIGGCSGNTQGIASLVKGINVEEVKRRLRGIRCGAKSTSCPDQLAQILENNF